MMTRNLRSLTSAVYPAALLLLASPAFAQITREWSTAVAPDETIAFAAGDFSSSSLLRQSIVAVRRNAAGTDAVLSFVFDPSYHDSFVEIAAPLTNPSQLVALRRDGAPDRVFVTGNGSPFIGSHNGVGLSALTVALPAWADVGMLRVRPLGGDDFMLLGRSPTGDALTVEVNSETGAVTNAQSFYGGPVAPMDVDLVDWNGNGSVEIASVLANGVAIMQPGTGTVIQWIPLPSPHASLATMRGDDGVGGVRERLAVLYEQGTDFMVSVMDASSIDAPVAINTALVPGTMTDPEIVAADLSEDGSDDLHVWQPSSASGLSLHSQAGAGVWYPGPQISPYVYSYGPVAANGSALPSICYDMDVDGLMDSVTCFEGTEDMVHVAYDAGKSTLIIDPPPVALASTISGLSADYQLQEGEWLVMLGLTGPGTGATVTVWQQPDPIANPSSKLDPVAFVPSTDLALNGGELNYVFSVNSLAVGVEGLWPNREHLWVEVKFTDSDQAESSAWVAVRVDNVRNTATSVPLGPYLDPEFVQPSSEELGLPDRTSKPPGAVLGDPVGPPPFPTTDVPSDG
ncbi:MAG: hypothetical protein AB8H79_21170 [Myxococcota bacterium]